MQYNQWLLRARVDWLCDCQRAWGTLGSKVIEMLYILIVGQLHRYMYYMCICQNLKCVHFIIYKIYFEKVDLKAKKENKYLWLMKPTLGEKSPGSQVKTENLGPETMNLIKASLTEVINFEPFASYWKNWVTWDQNKRSLVHFVCNLKS